MGDVSLAQDLLEGVADALSEVGTTRTLVLMVEGTIDPDHPGAGPPLTPSSISVQAIITDYKEYYINGTSILDGDKQALIDINLLTEAQINAIKPGNSLQDGDTLYKIIRPSKYEVAGVPVAVLAQLRRA